MSLTHPLTAAPDLRHALEAPAATDLRPIIESPAAPKAAPTLDLPAAKSRTALMIVDMQIDFLGSEGSMRIPGASKIVEKCKGWYKLAHFSKWPIICTLDWHPADHISFIPNGGHHPIHCIKGWKGAGLHSGLNITPAHVYMGMKGENPTDDPQDAWGAIIHFEGKDASPLEIFQAAEVSNLFITGVAAEYTIKETALKAVTLGFHTIVPSDAIAGMHPAGTARALDEMRKEGVTVL